MGKKLLARFLKKKVSKGGKPARLIRLQATADRLDKTLLDLDKELIEVRRLVFQNDPKAVVAVQKYNIRLRIIKNQALKIQKLIDAELMKKK